jgi:protein-disulfide isomerase
MRRKPHTTRRSVLTATGALSVLGLAGVASGDESGDGETTPVGDEIPTPETASEDASEEDDEPAFPTIGDNDDAPTATVYINVKCPHTEEFVFGNLEGIVDEFVATGRLNVQFCNLSYEPGDSSTPYISDSDPRIAAVELAVWDEDPDSYWRYFFETYADAPSGYVGYDELESRASDADVPNADAVVERARSGEYDADLEEVADLAAEAEISFSPQLELSDETIAPHHDSESLLDWIEARLETDGSEEESTESDESAEEEPEEQPEDGEEQPDDADEAANESEESDDDGSEYEDTEYDESDDSEDDSDEDDEAAGDGPSLGDSDAGDGIGAGMEYDLDGDRTVDDLPIDCD